VEWLRHNCEEARGLLCESIAALRDLRMWGRIAMDLRLLAHVTAACGEPERSACLFGAVAALQERLRDTRFVPAVRQREQLFDPARMEASQAACFAKLSPAAIEAAWTAGQAMTTDEAVAFALVARTNAHRARTGVGRVGDWHGRGAKSAGVPL
jgi:hypothetical protein